MDILEQDQIEKHNSYTEKIMGTKIRGLVNNSAYVEDWEERVNLEKDNAFIYLKFHDEYTPEDRAYTVVARELRDSEINGTIVSELSGGVYIEPSFSGDILDFHREERD